jgi:AmpD protein
LKLHIDSASGLIAGAQQRPSPNCDDRPTGSRLDLIVIHGISLPPGQFGGSWIDALFTNTLDPKAHPYFQDIHHLRVSAHALIRRDGELVQYVPLHKRAWHAGTSCHAGRTNCNDFTVGIELEGSDEQSYEPIQYHVLAQLITALRAAYASLQHAPLVGHSDIAPGRKTDPGPHFDWRHLHALLAS